MMNFAEAWDALALGQWVRVSNGEIEPPAEAVQRHNIWRSHNFDGQLVAQIGGPPRAMTLELEPTASAHVGYTVAEGGGHLFEPI